MGLHMNSMRGEPQQRTRREGGAWDGARTGGDLPPVDLRALARTLWRGRWIVAACCVAAVALSLLLIARIETTYTAWTQVLLLADEADARSAELDGTRALDDQRLATEVEIIYSTVVLDAVVEELDLASDPEVVGAVGTEASRMGGIAERLSEAMPERLAAVFERLAAPLRQAGSPEAPDASPRMLAIEHLREHLSVQQISESRVIGLSYTADSPSEAARTANAVADAYIADRTAARVRARERSLSWLNERVERLREQIQSSEDAVEVRRAELLMEAGQGLEITRRHLDARAQELADASSEAARLALLDQRLSEALGDEGGGLLTAELRDAEPIEALREEERTLRERIRDLAEGNAARPLLEGELADTRDRIRAEAERIALSVREDLRAARAREAQLADAVRELEDQALAQTRAELDLRQLEMNAEAGRRSYEEAMQQLFRTSGRPELERADIRILSRAEPPRYPDSQREKTILLLSLVTGGLVGVGLVILRSQMNDAFRSARDLEEATGLPVLGSIPKARARRGQGVVAYFRQKPRSTLAEAVRGLCTSVVAPGGGSPPQVIMLTAPSVDEGKSTAAVLTALGFRRLGRSVVLVDCDLRRPRVAALLGEPSSAPGLRSVVQGQHPLEEAVRTSGAEGLAVLPAGPATAADGEGGGDAFVSERFEEVIDALRRRYDVVVLNTPPALMTADARIITRAADAVLFVVRWNRTPREAVHEGIAALSAAGAPLRGAVLTVLDERRADEAFPAAHRRRRARRLGYFQN